MAGFTSLALAGALGFMAAKKLKKDPAQTSQQVAPGPTDANSGTQPPAPPLVDPAAQNAQGLAAGQRTRKNAARGALGTRPLPKAGTLPAKVTPKTLVGY